MRKLLRNQRGQSILVTVAGISAFLIALPLGLIAYWKNNLVAATRVREAYNLMNAMEQAARDVRADWDIAMGSSANQTPSVLRNYVVITMPTLNPAQAVPDQTCASTCSANNNGVVPILCYPNPQNNSSPYCFYGTLMTTTARHIELRIPNEKKPDLFEKTGFKIAQALDYFHIKKDTSLSVFEKTAFAAFAPLPPNRADNVGVNAVCGAGNNTPPCMTCGAAAGSKRPCTIIYACPFSFPSCAAYDGTAAKAIFSQQFFILPNGDTNTAAF